MGNGNNDNIFIYSMIYSITSEIMQIVLIRKFMQSHVARWLVLLFEWVEWMLCINIDWYPMYIVHNSHIIYIYKYVCKYKRRVNANWRYYAPLHILDVILQRMNIVHKWVAWSDRLLHIPAYSDIQSKTNIWRHIPLVYHYYSPSMHIHGCRSWI